MSKKKKNENAAGSKKASKTNRCPKPKQKRKIESMSKKKKNVNAAGSKKASNTNECPKPKRKRKIESTRISPIFSNNRNAAANTHANAAYENPDSGPRRFQLGNSGLQSIFNHLQGSTRGKKRIRPDRTEGPKKENLKKAPAAKKHGPSQPRRRIKPSANQVNGTAPRMQSNPKGKKLPSHGQQTRGKPFEVGVPRSGLESNLQLERSGGSSAKEEVKGNSIMDLNVFLSGKKGPGHKPRPRFTDLNMFLNGKKKSDDSVSRNEAKTFNTIEQRKKNLNSSEDHGVLNKKMSGEKETGTYAVQCLNSTSKPDIHSDAIQTSIVNNVDADVESVLKLHKYPLQSPDIQRKIDEHEESKQAPNCREGIQISMALDDDTRCDEIQCASDQTNNNGEAQLPINESKTDEIETEPCVECCSPEGPSVIPPKTKQLLVEGDGEYAMDVTETEHMQVHTPTYQLNVDHILPLSPSANNHVIDPISVQTCNLNEEVQLPIIKIQNADEIETKPCVESCVRGKTEEVPQGGSADAMDVSEPIQLHISPSQETSEHLSLGCSSSSSPSNHEFGSKRESLDVSLGEQDVHKSPSSFSTSKKMSQRSTDCLHDDLSSIRHQRKRSKIEKKARHSHKQEILDAIDLKERKSKKSSRAHISAVRAGERGRVGRSDVLLHTKITATTRTEDSKLLFLPRNRKASTLLKNKAYIQSYISKLLPSGEAEKFANLHSFLTNDPRRKFDGDDQTFSLIRQVTRVLLAAMGFDHNRASDLGEVAIPIKPLDKKATERASSVKKIVCLQIEVLKSQGKATCHLMEEVALAYRLAAHFTLVTCETLIELHKKNSVKKTKLIKLQVRAILTLVVSLRDLFSTLMKEHISDNDKEITSRCAVDDDVRFFFSTELCESFNGAEVLVVDCVSLLIELEGESRMKDSKRTKQLAEYMLKLDKDGGKREDMKSTFGISDGLMELLFRQLLFHEVNATVPGYPIRRHLQELRHRHLATSGALASTLDQITPGCNEAINTITSLRLDHLKVMLDFEKKSGQETGGQLSPSPIHDSSQSIDKVVTENVDILRVDGCIFLSKVIRVYNASSGTSRDAGVLIPSRYITNMAFYLFHTLMEHDPHDGKNSKNEAISIRQRVNLESAVLAAMYLATKCLDCAVPLKQIIGYANTVSRTQGVPRDKSLGYRATRPHRNLVKKYEQHLLILHGYSAPDATILPVTYVETVLEYLNLPLDEKIITRFERVFDHVGYKYSAICLLVDPLLVSFAVYHFGSEHLQLLERSSSWNEALEGDSRRAVEVISSYMVEMNIYESTRCKSQSSNATPELREDYFTPLSAILEDINS